MSPALAVVHPVALELLARAKTGEGVKSGPIGLAVILVLCIASYFLFKSMSKHMRRVREDFPQDEPAATTSLHKEPAEVADPAPAPADRVEPAEVPPSAPPRQDPA